MIWSETSRIAGRAGSSPIRGCALALAAIGAALVTLGAGPAPPVAAAPSFSECAPVGVPGLTLKRIRPHRFSCQDARFTLRNWLRTGPAPEEPLHELARPEFRVGWWCASDTGDHEGPLRCMIGSGANAPWVEFLAVPAPPLNRCRAAAGAWSPFTGARPSATSLYAHGISCRDARELLRFWIEHPHGGAPQQGFGPFLPRGAPWWCGRPQPDAERLDRFGPVGCSFDDGVNTAYMRFVLNPAATDVQGAFFEGRVFSSSTGLAIDKEEYLGSYQFDGCTSSDCAGRRRVVTRDMKANGWSVLLEIWSGGELRSVCWDAARTRRSNPCQVPVARGERMTFLLAEARKRVWDRCWRRRGGAWRAPHGPCGKRRGRWAGPQRTGVPPAGWGPGVWGEGEFRARG